MEEEVTNTTDNTPAVEPTQEAVGNNPSQGGDESLGEAKPFLGGDDKASEPSENKGEGVPNEQNEESKVPSEEDYLQAVVKDDAILGADSNVELDKTLIKALIPEAQKLGVTPAQMKSLANTLAKAQMEQGKEMLKSRIDYFEKMKAESMKKYSRQDFEQINRGIDKWFAPNGVMNNVIRNSELGADPEFLALMHYLGEAVKEDGLAGASSGGGSGMGDGNGIEGLSKLW